MQSAGPIPPASEYEAIKFAHDYLSFGVDCIYVGNHSLKYRLKSTHGFSVDLKLVPMVKNSTHGFKMHNPGFKK